MKITHNKVGQNLNTADTNKSSKTDKANQKGNVGADISAISGKSAEGATAAGAAGAAAKVELSSRAQQIKQATDIAKADPGVDEAKVARLQKMIDGGQYKTDASAIAGKMLDEQMSWE